MTDKPKCNCDHCMPDGCANLPKAERVPSRGDKIVDLDSYGHLVIAKVWPGGFSARPRYNGLGTWYRTEERGETWDFDDSSDKPAEPTASELPYKLEDHARPGDMTEREREAHQIKVARIEGGDLAARDCAERIFAAKQS